MYGFVCRIIIIIDFRSFEENRNDDDDDDDDTHVCLTLVEFMIE